MVFFTQKQDSKPPSTARAFRFLVCLVGHSPIKHLRINMLTRQSARLIRASVQTRNVSMLVNKPSHVAADQKLFTTSHKHTYVKRSSDNGIYFGLLGLTGFGFLQFFRGELHMANGTHKKD